MNSLSPKAAGALAASPVGVLAVYVLSLFHLDTPPLVVAAGVGILSAAGSYVMRDGLRDIGRNILEGQVYLPTAPAGQGDAAPAQDVPGDVPAPDVSDVPQDAPAEPAPAEVAPVSDAAPVQPVTVTLDPAQLAVFQSVVAQLSPPIA